MENETKTQTRTATVSAAAKKLLSILLAFVMLFSITAGIDLSAYADTSGDWEYVIQDDGSVGITGYNGSSKNLTIPSTINDKTVTCIHSYAFYENTNLTNIVISDSVTEIGFLAFAGCKKLKSVTLSKRLKEIDYAVFDRCVNLTDIEIPNSVISIGYWSFLNCTGLKTITIPASVKDISIDAFLGCTNLKDITILSKKVNIGLSAFGYYQDNEDGEISEKHIDGVKIHGYQNSTAEKYARENNIKFVAICEHTYKTTVTKATTSKNGSSVTKCTKCGTVSKKSTIAYPKTVTLSATSYTYDGKAKKPTVTVKDSAGKTIAASNYTVAYSNNTNVGTATAKITFKGNYSGSISKTFKINPKNTSISSVSALYKGFTVKYAKQATQTTGYQIQYSTSSNFSNAKTVTINKNSTVVKNVTGLTAKKKYYVRIRTYKTVGKTNYYSAWSGAKNVTTSSYPTGISLSATSYTYDGKVKKPSVTVKHGPNKIASKYYTVSYSSGRKNVGTYTVTIKFKAPYSGTVKKTFKINPKNTSISSLSAQSKAFTVKLKKYTTQTTGYQIQYSTSSNFSNAKTVTVKNTTTSKKVTGLTGNKKYYVRIRTYKTVGKTNYYSAWSGSKTVTTKK